MARKARSIKQRREIFEDFDRIELRARPELVFSLREGYLLIEKIDQGYLVQYCTGWEDSKEIEVSIALEGNDAARLRSELDKTKAYQWTREFRPLDYQVLDGYDWTMDFYKGDSYFQTCGGNAAPQELLDFYEYIVSLGLPRLESLDEIAEFGWEATMRPPWDQLEALHEKYIER